MGGGGGISLTARERGLGEPLGLVGPALPPELVFKWPPGTVQHGIISVVPLFLLFHTASFPVGRESTPVFSWKCLSKILAAKISLQKLQKLGGGLGNPHSFTSSNVTFLPREANDPIKKYHCFPPTFPTLVPCFTNTFCLSVSFTCFSVSAPLPPH